MAAAAGSVVCVRHHSVYATVRRAAGKDGGQAFGGAEEKPAGTERDDQRILQHGPAPALGAGRPERQQIDQRRKDERQRRGRDGTDERDEGAEVRDDRGQHEREQDGREPQPVLGQCPVPEVARDGRRQYRHRHVELEGVRGEHGHRHQQADDLGEPDGRKTAKGV